MIMKLLKMFSLIGTCIVFLFIFADHQFVHAKGEDIYQIIKENILLFEDYDDFCDINGDGCVDVFDAIRANRNDIKELKKSLVELKEELNEQKESINSVKELNCYDSITEAFMIFRTNNPYYFTKTKDDTYRRTVNGITYEWDSDFQVCHVYGTAKGYAPCNIYNVPTNNPFKPGKYRVEFNSTDTSNISLDVGLYLNGATSGAFINKYYGDFDLEIPVELM